MLELGKTYSFKTLTFYYIGTVVWQSPTHVKIVEATEVFETGPNVDYYAGTIKKHERIPDGAFVPMNGTLVTPYEHVVSRISL